MSFVANEVDPFTRKDLRFWLLVAPQHHVTSDHHTHRSEGIAQRGRDAENPNPFSLRLRLSARDYFRVPFCAVFRTDRSPARKTPLFGSFDPYPAQPRALWQNPVGIPGGKTAIALPSAFANGEIGQRPPTHAIPNAKGVVPYSPGLRRPRRYPGYEDGLPFNANGVVPKHRRFGLPCSGSVAIPRTNHHVAHSAGFVNPLSLIHI